MYRRLQNFSFFFRTVDRTDRAQPQDFSVTGRGALKQGGDRTFTGLIEGYYI